MRVAVEEAAPTTARVHAVNPSRDARPGPVRGDPEERKVALVGALRKVFGEPAPTEVREAAVDAVAAAHLAALSQYLYELSTCPNPGRW